MRRPRRVAITRRHRPRDPDRRPATCPRRARRRQGRHRRYNRRCRGQPPDMRDRDHALAGREAGALPAGDRRSRNLHEEVCGDCCGARVRPSPHAVSARPDRRSTRARKAGATCDDRGDRAKAPDIVIVIVDGAPGFEAALAELWPDAPVPRCTVRPQAPTCSPMRRRRCRTCGPRTAATWPPSRSDPHRKTFRRADDGAQRANDDNGRPQALRHTEVRDRRLEGSYRRDPVGSTSK